MLSYLCVCLCVWKKYFINKFAKLTNVLMMSVHVDYNRWVFCQFFVGLLFRLFQTSSKVYVIDVYALADTHTYTTVIICAQLPDCVCEWTLERMNGRHFIYSEQQPKTKWFNKACEKSKVLPKVFKPYTDTFVRCIASYSVLSMQSSRPYVCVCVGMR